MHDEIRLIRHGSKPRGCRGAKHPAGAARGTFIAFFDDDDESAPDRLEQQYRRIVEYEANASRGGSLLLLESDRRAGGRTAADSERLGIGRRPPEPIGRDRG